MMEMQEVVDRLELLLGFDLQLLTEARQHAESGTEAPAHVREAIESRVAELEAEWREREVCMTADEEQMALEPLPVEEALGLYSKLLMSAGALVDDMCIHSRAARRHWAAHDFERSIGEKALSIIGAASATWDDLVRDAQEALQILDASWAAWIERREAVASRAEESE